MKRNSGFTLIELLVVITIIGILAGLAFPAITGALEAAKKAEANAMINQLKIAMTSYQTEYGVWPSPATEDASGFNAGALFKMLQGNDEPAGDNPRQIVFMEFSKKVMREGPASYTNKTPPADPSDATTFVDPWHQEYKMTVDADYNNQLDVPGGTINASIAIWSTGKPSGSTANTDESKFIKSW